MKEKTSIEIEKCLLRFMDQLESLEEKRQRFNALIEQGWFSISKARYAMGNKQVSALQYSSEIEPQISVHVRTLPNGEAEFQAEWPESDFQQVEIIGPKDGGVRRRTTTKTTNPKEEPAVSKKDVSEDDASSESRSPSRQRDPLKWFGILVPQSLRQAQSSFKQVIELSADIAALQSAIIATREKLRSLMDQKQNELQDGTATGSLRPSAASTGLPSPLSF